jgi:putative restriction endonuclease
MPLKLVVALTDPEWFQYLRGKPDLEEGNFWAPSPRSFRALTPGEFFLFRLHAPYRTIVGGGVFARAQTLPCWLAWDAFQEANGAGSLAQMRARIARYRTGPSGEQTDFLIGCRILTQPFFLDEGDWFEPPNWPPHFQGFKTYSTDTADGLMLWETARSHLNSAVSYNRAASEFRGASETPAAGWGEPALIRPRLGQGAFRIVVTDNYQRRCAVTGERTLPALDAAHIRPYAAQGVHEPTNGLLLRRDIHSLFDRGYVTVTPTHHFEVSGRIRDEFENGRDYYAMHGRYVQVPPRPDQRPDSEALVWHNENRFLG